MVVEGHVWDFGMGIETYDSLSGLMLYTFNMPIFFFASGFLAYKVKLELSDTIKKIRQKFIYLVIPAVIFYIFRQLQGCGNPLNILTMGFGGYWFTITLFECFFIYYLTALVLPNNKLQDAVLIGLAILGIGFLSVVGEYGPKLLDLNRLTKYFQFFAMGVLAMKYRTSYEKLMHNEPLKAVALIGFFALLFTVNNAIWPRPVFHLLRDIVLRYLGTFVVISWFVNHTEAFNVDSRINRLILDIGKKSLAIYLLQYFFIPDFNAYTTWLSGMDGFTVHVISFAYTVVIIAICYVFISLLSNSMLIKKYVLGQK